MERTVRIAICEDLAQDANALEHMLAHGAAHRGLSLFLSRYESAEALLDSFSAGQFDVLFLDIYLGGQTGIEAAREIRRKDPECLLIFTTSSQDHALEGYSVRALHYLIKPVTQSGVEEALDRVLHQLKDIQEQSIQVMIDRKPRTIPLKDILYVEIHNKQCHIQTRQGPLYSRIALDDLARKLPMPPFLRCHRSGIVNLGYVRSIGRDFVMVNGDILCIRQVDLKEIKAQYMHYLMDITRRDLRA